MPRFAANLTTLFTELPMLERFGAAAEAGFAAVEMQFPYAWPAADLRARLDEHRLGLVLHNLPAGDWAAGERGIACHPDRVEEFRAGVVQAIEYARQLGARQLNCLAGKLPLGVGAGQAHDTLVANLRYAADALRGAGLTLLVEPVNTFDVPGFLVSRSAQALALIDEVGAANLLLQYDVYHAQRMEGELAGSLERHLARIGHIQISDNPGRHEPGTGEIHFAHLFALLDRMGYQGWVGCEYTPRGGTAAGLAWREQYGLAPSAPAAQHLPAPRELLRAMFDAAVAAAQPEHCVPPHLPDPSQLRGRLVVIGAGKASAAMALAVEQHWPGPLSGLVVTRYGHGAPCQRIEVVEAAHPVPDAAGERAAARMLALCEGLDENDLVLCLMSGGGSALLPLPLAGVTLADKQALGRALLASGASISEINCVRRHLSAIKGGRLAAACHPAPVRTLAISDVPGDDPVDIASGPTVADLTRCADALEILRRYAIALPEEVRAVLESGRGESVKPGDPRLAQSEVRIVAAPQQSLEAAARVAREAGYAAHILSDRLEGEARAMGSVLAGIARQVAERGQPVKAPCVLLSGGEATVTVRGGGRGGRNVECLLACALALAGHPRIHGLAADTDGVDGMEETAGAWLAPDTLARAWALGLNPAACLADNDGHRFFEVLGDALITGPTRTNVNDFRALLVQA